MHAELIVLQEDVSDECSKIRFLLAEDAPSSSPLPELPSSSLA
jgi:hypothetical protein